MEKSNKILELRISLLGLTLITGCSLVGFSFEDKTFNDKKVEIDTNTDDMVFAFDNVPEFKNINIDTPIELLKREEKVSPILLEEVLPIEMINKNEKNIIEESLIQEYIDATIKDSSDFVEKVVETREEEEVITEPTDIEKALEAYKNGYDNERDIEINNKDFKITLDNRVYDLSEDDFKFFVAVVCAESNGTFYDALTCASSILNRCESKKWVEWLNAFGKDGTNPVDQITFDGQFQVYSTGLYKNFLDLDNVNADVLLACELVCYQGVRSGSYCSFRSNDSIEYSDNQVVKNGNRFGDIIEEYYEDLEIKQIDDEEKILTLEGNSKFLF